MGCNYLSPPLIPASHSPVFISAYHLSRSFAVYMKVGSLNPMFCCDLYCYHLIISNLTLRSFNHIVAVYFIGIGPTVGLPRRLWSNSEAWGRNQPVPNHSKHNSTRVIFWVVLNYKNCWIPQQIAMFDSQQTYDLSWDVFHYIYTLFPELYS